MLCGVTSRTLARLAALVVAVLAAAWGLLAIAVLHPGIGDLHGALLRAVLWYAAGVVAALVVITGALTHAASPLRRHLWLPTLVLVIVVVINAISPLNRTAWQLLVG